jgi:hypothetical protein
MDVSSPNKHQIYFILSPSSPPNSASLPIMQLHPSDTLLQSGERGASARGGAARWSGECVTIGQRPDGSSERGDGERSRQTDGLSEHNNDAVKRGGKGGRG